MANSPGWILWRPRPGRFSSEVRRKWTIRTLVEIGEVSQQVTPIITGPRNGEQANFFRKAPVPSEGRSTGVRRSITPAAKKVIYQPDAPARDPVRFPRWRVGLICSSMRNFLAGVIHNGEWLEPAAASSLGFWTDNQAVTTKKPGPHREGRAQPGRTTLARDLNEKAGTEFRWKDKKHRACRKNRIPAGSSSRTINHYSEMVYITRCEGWRKRADPVSAFSAVFFGMHVTFLSDRGKRSQRSHNPDPS